MNKVFNSFSILFLTLFSCNTDNAPSISASDYEKASFHMSRSLNKHLNNVLTYQKWDDEEIFHYKVRFKEKTEGSLVRKKLHEEIIFTVLKFLEKGISSFVVETTTSFRSVVSC